MSRLECARRLNLALNTVKRYARVGEPEPLQRAPQYRPTLVDPYRDHWITTATTADLPHLHAFTRGLAQDRDAVNAGLTLPHHNGGTEGVNTKTKRIMRQTHGRASFDLLRHRILLG